MSAKEKANVFEDFKRFVRFLTDNEWTIYNKRQTGSDYGLKAPKVFTKKLYEHLHLHCGFIAHYHINGFYSTYFDGSKNNLNKFIQKIDSLCNFGDYGDINFDIKEYLNKFKEYINNHFLNENDKNWNRLLEILEMAKDDDTVRDRLLTLIFG